MLVLPQRISAGRAQHLNRRCVTLVREYRPLERRIPVTIHRMNVAASFKQHSHDRGGLRLGRKVKRGPSVHVRRIHIRAGRELSSRFVNIPIRRGIMQRRTMELVEFAAFPKPHNGPTFTDRPGADR